ncbi:LLM class flavin-dependent oxidoreductase [Psychrobacillus vulpis]|uniref:LLM class flavin-dependent oxidoreductase n=1 Tax=Psychrobacillus vulpis TaxID=2325572 RepID=A0A544TRN8_9BACI|nr:LLM class flavin-dependent oxidoreductase [Psychrobacillus vulpis]TQR20116.1 LLM class flavin-dependent oxidoreductase [Psychrobacillus vulpis]
MMKKGIELGIYTLGDLGMDPHTGSTISMHQRLKEIIEMGKLADEAGFDIFGVGEHHRLDYAVSSPAVVLSAVAQVTKQIKLTSATSVLSTLDPVRLFEDFSTVDLLSNGRAEIIAGRGAFVESFPLFGYDLDEYDALFEENIKLLQQLNEEEIVSWQGQFRPSLTNAMISPRPVQKKLPLWVGVGGTPESAVRAGRLGTGMAMAILGGDPKRFKPLVDLYFQAGSEAGYSRDSLSVGVTGHTYITKESQQARDEFYPYYSNYWSYVNKQRGMETRVSRADFEIMASAETALFVGSPEEIIEKILYQHELFGHKRFIAQLDIGGQSFSNIVKGMELLATKVAPIVRRETSK